MSLFVWILRINANHQYYEKDERKYWSHYFTALYPFYSIFQKIIDNTQRDDLNWVHSIFSWMNISRVQKMINPVRFRDSTGLDWPGLAWTGLDWTELDWIGLDWIGFQIPESLIMTWINNTQLIKFVSPDLNFRFLLDSHIRICDRPFHQNVKMWKYQNIKILKYQNIKMFKRTLRGSR
jgi:hypothetical protein